MGETTRRDFDPSEAHWSYERLKEEMISACASERFRPGLVAFDRMPDSVDPGKFREKGLECTRGTLTDRKERGVGVEFLPVDRKMIMSKEVVVGEESQVLVPTPRSARELYADQMAKLPSFKQLLAPTVIGRLNALVGDGAAMNAAVQELYRGTSAESRVFRDVYLARPGHIHSHTRMMPFSPQDVRVFLSSAEHRVMLVSRSDGVVEMMVKSTETPFLDREASEERNRVWNEMVDRRVTDSMKGGMDSTEANQRGQAALVRSIANKYKFGYYVGGETGPLTRVR